MFAGVTETEPLVNKVAKKKTKETTAFQQFDWKISNDKWVSTWAHVHTQSERVN